MRGNMLAQRFGFLPLEVKFQLFKMYCYPMYTSALWSRYKQASLNRLKVAYNNITRRLSYTPPWGSASYMFGMLGVRSFQESIRVHTYSLNQRIASCPNDFIKSLSRSDAAALSVQQENWRKVLFC